MYVGDDAVTAPAGGVSLVTVAIVAVCAWILFGRK